MNKEAAAGGKFSAAIFCVKWVENRGSNVGNELIININHKFKNKAFKLAQLEVSSQVGSHEPIAFEFVFFPRVKEGR